MTTTLASPGAMLFGFLMTRAFSRISRHDVMVQCKLESTGVVDAERLCVWLSTNPSIPPELIECFIFEFIDLDEATVARAMSEFDALLTDLSVRRSRRRYRRLTDGA